jgi:hypothetical protein
LKHQRNLSLNALALKSEMFLLLLLMMCGLLRC